MKYEYKLIVGRTDVADLEAQLNKLGAEGWKVVAATEVYNSNEEYSQDTVYLMREVP